MAKIPIAVLIGSGSKLPALIKEKKLNSSKFEIRLVVSHRSDSAGIKLAIKNNIPAVYFKLPDYRARLFKGDSQISRVEYMKNLGWFISQREYAPKLLVFAGWDLVMDKNFFEFFRSGFGEGYAAINLHPALLPTAAEKNEIKLPDGTISPIIKGQQEQVLETVIKKNLTYFGPSVHFMKADEFDVGAVIERSFIKVGDSKTTEELKKKLMPIEDQLLIASINKVMGKL